MKYKKYLIAGAAGQLGVEFVRQLAQSEATVIAPTEQELDITRPELIQAMIAAEKPDVLINCAAYNHVDAAQQDPQAAFLINDTAVGYLVDACRQAGVFLVHYGSDYVFDGAKQEFYTEDDTPGPLNEYGKSKLQGEEQALRLSDASLVLRLSWVFGPGEQNFLHKLNTWAASRKVLRINAEEVSVPTYVEDIVDVTLRALAQGITGRYHLTNSGYASRYEWARYYAKKMEWDTLIIPAPAAEFPLPAPRPRFSCLSNQALSRALNLTIPDWEDAVERYVLSSDDM